MRAFHVHVKSMVSGGETEFPPTQSILTARGLTYQLPDGRLLFQGLELQLGALHYGLLGLNGVGKTTLAQLLAGALEPTGGEVIRTGKLAVLPQVRASLLGVVPEPSRSAEAMRSAELWGDGVLTVMDVLGVREVFDALRQLERGGEPEQLEALLTLVGDRWQLEHEVAEVLAQVGLAGLDPARPFLTLSGGEQTRVRLAACLLKQPDFLILDEPTNHLDQQAREALGEFLEQWPGGALVISHDRALLSQVDVMLELTPKGLEVFGGSWPEYQLSRQRQQAAEQRALHSAQQQLELQERQAQAAQERQARRVARGRRLREKAGMPRIALNTMKGWAEASTSRLKGRHEALLRATRETYLELKAQEEPVRSLHMDLGGERLASQRRVVSLEGVGFGYPGGHPVLKDFWLELVGPERVALTGPNGCGKSTVLKLVEGLLQPTTGRVVRYGVELASLSQLGESLDQNLTVLEQLRKVTVGMEELTRRLKLGRFFFRGERANVRVGALSGGERLRLGLACAFVRQPGPQLLLLDEPSNDLDLESLEVLEAALREYEGALLVCSHDPYFLDAVGITREVRLAPTP